MDLLPMSVFTDGEGSFIDFLYGKPGIVDHLNLRYIYIVASKAVKLLLLSA
ncbi:hypothetical protein D3C75_523130 [compost metagenome]